MASLHAAPPTPIVLMLAAALRAIRAGQQT
jgi:hypothetical protein